MAKKTKTKIVLSAIFLHDKNEQWKCFQMSHLSFFFFTLFKYVSFLSNRFVTLLINRLAQGAREQLIH